MLHFESSLKEIHYFLLMKGVQILELSPFGIAADDIESRLHAKDRLETLNCVYVLEEVGDEQIFDLLFLLG